mgnify:CR=1 FL=1
MKVGIVVIGRNEEKNLSNCLESCLKQNQQLVYVDSGSTDNSVQIANSYGVDVVELDPSLPFTAARGRNTGADYLAQKYPGLEYVQFIDGDCELWEGWIDAAVKKLEQRPEVAIVCGILQERYPNKSIYNYLCSLEWRREEGETNSCGGLFMVRLKPFLELNGFKATIIGGEEPELCFRLRQKGWKIWRIEHKMALHDADMTSLNQFWKRSIRNGHAYAEGAYLHGSETEEKYNVKETLSYLFWGLFLPVSCLITAWVTKGLSLLLLFSAYSFLAFRVYRYQKSREWSSQDALTYAIYVICDKFPGMLGISKFYLYTLRNSYNIEKS